MMSANSIVRARIDERIKDEAAAVLGAMGLTVSSRAGSSLWLFCVSLGGDFSILLPEFVLGYFELSLLTRRNRPRKSSGPPPVMSMALPRKLDLPSDRPSLRRLQRPRSNRKADHYNNDDEPGQPRASTANSPAMVHLA